MKIILFLIFLFFNLKGFSQDKMIKFDHLTMKTGLPENSILCVLKDHLGYLWIGIANGLVRYDGNNFKVFKKIENDSTSISGNRIWTIFEDRDNVLWIAADCYKGVNSYDYKTEKFQHYYLDNKREADIANICFEINQTSDGLLWFGGWNGLRTYDKKTKTSTFHFADKKPGNLSATAPFKVIEDNQHKVWVLTWGNKLNLYHKASNDFEQIQIPLSGDYWKKVVKDRDGMFYIICYGCGITKFDPIKKTNIETINPAQCLSGNYCTGFNTPDNMLWLGSDGDGITIYDPQKNTYQSIKNNPNYPASISDNSQTTLYRDDMGIVWSGGWNSGLNTYDPLKYKFFLYENIPGIDQAFTNKTINTLYQDSQNRIWLGTDGDGLWLYDTETHQFKSYFLASINKPRLNKIISIGEDNFGNLLLGTNGEGLMLLNPQNKQVKYFQTADKPEFLHGSVINTIKKTKSGRIFIGYSSQYHCIAQEYDDKNQKFIEPKLFDKLDQNILTMFEDSKGILWIGGQIGVVAYNYVDKKYTHYKKSKNELSNDEICIIYEDHDHNMWFGSESNGLDIFNPKSKQWKHYSETNGLLSNIVQGILQDKKGNMWISTTKGLQKFNPKTQTFINYDFEDGLQAGQFKKNCSIEANNGLFYFGGTGGLNCFYPDSIKQSDFSPRIMFTNLLLNNHKIEPLDATGILKYPLSQTDTIILTYKQSMFSLEYNALVFSKQNKVKYSYILDGFQKNWIEVGTERKATFTNLDAGKYKFRVKATNNDGVWGENEAFFTNNCHSSILGNMVV